MKFLAPVVAALLSLPATVLAQAIPGTPYVRLSESQTYVDLTNPTVLFTNALTSTADVMLPFSFKFYDRMYTSVSAGTDGAIIMGGGSSVSNVNSAPASTSTPQAFIAPYWDSSQFCAADMGHLGYEVLGTAPNRVVVFEWRRLNIGACTPQSLMSYQLRLHEGTAGRIEIDYGPSVGLSATTLSGTMGMEDQVGARPILFRACATNTTCNATDFNAMTGTRVTIVQDPGIDVAATKIEAPPFMPLEATRPVAVTVTNNHGTATGPIDIILRASPDGTLANSTPVGSTTVSIPPYASPSITIDATPPAMLGAQNVNLVLVVDVGGQLTEVDESNNVRISDDRVRLLPANPDFVVEVVTTDRTIANGGDDIQVRTRIRNIGVGSTNPVDIAVFLSSNPAVSASDLELTRTSVTLATGEAATLDMTASIPVGIASGRYTLGVLADPGQSTPELSKSNNSAIAPEPIDITGAAISIVTTRLPAARVRQSYVGVVQTLGAVGTLRVEVVAGALPGGIGIVSSTGEIFGRPTKVGCDDFTVRATDDNSSAEKALTLCVVDPAEPLTIVTRDVPLATRGQEYVAPFIATGGEAGTTLVWSATGLPDGFNMTAEGFLAGTPDAIGEFELTVSVTDGTATAERIVTLEVVDTNRLTLITTPLPSAQIDTAYEARFEARGGNGTIAFTIDFGQLPDGLALEVDGRLAGTPRVAGSFYFGVRVRDQVAGSSPASDVDAFTLKVDDNGTLMISTDRLPNAIIDAGYDTTVEAAGGLAPYEWTIIEGRLPEGLLSDVDGTTGALRLVGSPRDLGVFSLLLRVEDAQGREAIRAFSLTVEEPPADSDEPIDDGCVCVDGERSATTALMFVFGLVVLMRRRR